MNNTLILSFSQAIVAQAGASSLNTTSLVFGILALIAGAVAFFAFSRVKNLTLHTMSLDEKISNKSEELKTITAARKKLQNNLDEKNEKIQKLKKDLASQRKKNHAAGEESKQLRQQHQSEITRLEKEQGNKPAYTSQKPTQTQKPAPIKAPPTSIQAPQEVKAAPVVTESDVIKQLRNEVARAQDERDKSVKKLKNENDTYRAARRDLKELKFRVERYRRVDIMTHNQLELANDKLLTLGRQYYDSVSELAAAKGDVIPPKPKALREAEAEAAIRALEAANAEANSEIEAAEITPQKEAPVSLSSIDIEELERVAPIDLEEPEAPTPPQAPAASETAPTEASPAPTL